MAIEQGTFDIVFDAIKTALEDYNTEQDSDDQFTLYEDWYRPADSLSPGAYVFLYMGSIVPKAATVGYREQSVTYYIDMIVSKKGKSDDGYTRADAAAGARYRLLVQQVLSALHGSDNFNLGLDAGTINGKDIRIDTTIIDSQTGEQKVAAGRLTFSTSMAYSPSEMEGIDLEKIMITADKWSALMEE